MASPHRRAARHRKTRESEIAVEVDLDGSGRIEVTTGLPFFDHMLSQLGTHGGLDLVVRATGDLEVDAHHTVEDTGIALGEALAAAFGDKAGIRRFASVAVPLDEALVEAALDVSGRAYLPLRDRLRARHAGARLAAFRPTTRRGVLARPRHRLGRDAARLPPVRQEHPPRVGGVVQGGRPGAF